MKLRDIIDLAKLGYKKEDIEDLISMAAAAEEPESKEPENGPEDVPAGEPEGSSPDPDDPGKSADDDKSGQELKALQDQITDLKKQLENAQKQNINKNNSGSSQEHSDQDVLNDIVRNFM